MLRILTPDLRVKSVLDLTVERVRQMGIDSLLLDVDCTLKRYRQSEVAPEVAAWIKEMRAAGISLCLVSNGWGNRIGLFAGELGIPFVRRALKPLPTGCQAAIRKIGGKRGRTAMVGDQLFADVLAARLAGLTSILVRPIHPEDEPWFTRLKRGPERWLLGWLTEEP